MPSDISFIAWLGSAFLLIFLSVPVHEFFHLLAYLATGAKLSELEIVWFSFDAGGGYVAGKKYISTYHYWYEHQKILRFIIGLSGGLGTSIFLACLCLSILLYFPQFRLIWISLLGILALAHLMYGIFESIQAQSFSFKFQLREKF